MNEQRVRVWVQKFYDRPTLILQWVNPDTGQRRSKSARTTDFELAEIARRDLEYELNHGTYQEASKLEWERFRQLFEDEYLAGVRPRTRERYNGVLDVFEEIVKPEKLAAVTERTISLFVKGMRERKKPGNGIGLAPMTIKNYLVAVKTALGFGQASGFPRLGTCAGTLRIRFPGWISRGTLVGWFMTLVTKDLIAGLGRVGPGSQDFVGYEPIGRYIATRSAPSKRPGATNRLRNPVDL